MEARLATAIRDQCGQRALAREPHELVRVAIASVARVLPLVDHDARFRHFCAKLLVSRRAGFTAPRTHQRYFALRLPVSLRQAHVARREILLSLEESDLGCRARSLKRRGPEPDPIDVGRRGERRIAHVAHPALERDPRSAHAVLEPARLSSSMTSMLRAP